MLPARLSTLLNRIGDLAGFPAGSLHGSDGASDPWITGFADNALHPHGDGALCMLADAHFAERLRGGTFAVVVAPPSLLAIAEAVAPIVYLHESPRRVFVALLEACALARPPAGISPLADIHTSAQIAPTAAVAAFVVVEALAVVGDDVRIGPGAVIGEGSSVGAGSEIGPRVVLASGTIVGAGCRIDAGAVIGAHGFGYLPSDSPGEAPRPIPHVGGVVLEDDVHVGALTSIARGSISPTRIRRGARIDAHVHIGHNADVGERAFLAGQTGLAGSVVIGHDAMLGGQVGVGDHLTVGCNARVAGGSGVIGNVPDGGVVGGYPARPRAQWLRATARMYRKGKQ